ncbi:MAG: AraC family transcriptional regulator [Candidatus Firestonebacteria bacterium]
MRKNEQKTVRRTFGPKDHGFKEVPVFGNYNTGKALTPLQSHTHEGFEICYLKKGYQNYSVFGKDYLLKSGDIFLTKPGESHSSGKQSQEKGELYWINMRPLPGKNNIFGLGPKQSKLLIKELLGIKKRFFPASRELQAAFTNTHRLLLLPKHPLRHIALSTAFVHIILELLKCASKSNRQEGSSMNRVIQHIDKYIEDNIRIPDLAAFMGLSSSWFKARFRKETGLPPAEYILRKKILKAREYLESGKGNISDTAMKFGFSSSQHFATAFKRYNKQTPRETIKTKLV